MDEPEKIVDDATAGPPEKIVDASIWAPPEKIFDAPVLPPPGEAFKPFPEAWAAGPIPARLRGEDICELTALLTGLDAAGAARLVEFGSVWLDDRPVLDPARPLAGHASFRINPPAYGPIYFYEASPERILYEDAHLLIYNKESGRPSQGVPHDAHNNALAALTRLLAARGGPSDLWLLHRLDADTSGLLLLAKNREAAGLMGRAFQKGEVLKEYLCLGLGRGQPKKRFSVKNFIAKEGRRYVNRSKGPGLAAHTDFEFLEKENGPGGFEEALFKAMPRTGRTHQIRLHLLQAGWPISGDRFYGRAEIESARPAPRLMLASNRLAFEHPISGERVDVKII